MIQEAAFVVFSSLVAQGRLGKAANGRLTFSPHQTRNHDEHRTPTAARLRVHPTHFGRWACVYSIFPPFSLILPHTHVAEIQLDLRFQASSLLFFKKEICQFSNSVFSISIHQSPAAKQIDRKQPTSSAVSYRPYVPNPRQSKDQSTSRHHVSYCCS
jgi:hypothetical protein